MNEVLLKFHAKSNMVPGKVKCHKSQRNVELPDTVNWTGNVSGAHLRSVGCCACEVVQDIQLASYCQTAVGVYNTLVSASNEGQDRL